MDGSMFCALIVGAWALFRESPGVSLVAAGVEVGVERGREKVAAVPPFALREGDTVTVPLNGWAWIRYADGTAKTIQIKCRIDTEIEIDYVRHGGVLHYVLRDLAGVSSI